MRRPFFPYHLRRHLTISQRQRRDAESFDELGFRNGCVAMDDAAEQDFAELLDEAVEFDLSVLGSGDDQLGYDMPVIRLDDKYRQWRKTRIEQIEAVHENGQCTLPWEVLKALPGDRKKSDRLYFSQGNVGSCCAHAFAFAGMSATLTNMALGSPSVYCTINPIVAFYVLKGHLRGGAVVSDMAATNNKKGNWPEYLVGENNQRVPDGFEEYTDDAKKFQWGIMFLEDGKGNSLKGEQLATEIFLVCQSGSAVAVGNSHAVSGATRNSIGVKAAQLSGTWYHATHFAGYRKVNGMEYVGWINSHGPRYGASDEGEPADMCWMDYSTAVRFLASAPQYGAPCVVFPESIWKEDSSLVTGLDVPFPKNWRK